MAPRLPEAERDVEGLDEIAVGRACGRSVEVLGHVPAPAVRVEVVDDVAAAGDENALLAQRLEPIATWR